MRTFVKVVLSGGLLAGVIVGAAPASDAAINGDQRSYAVGKYELQIGSANSGFVTSMAGGEPVGDVVDEKVGPDHVAKKHLAAGVKYEAISIECGTGMSKGFYAWLADSFARKYTRQNGAVEVLDHNSKELSKLQFTGALLAEIGFPALDAASKDAAKLTVTFAPQSTKRIAGSQQAIGTHESVAAQKKWLPTNFRVTIPGLDTTRINKVDPIVFKQKIVQNAVGQLHDYTSEPADFEISNLVVTLPEANASTWYQWRDDFLVKGNNGDANEKNATIEYLAADQSVLFTLTLKHVGIFKLAADKVEAGSENIRRVKAEMYVEDASFAFNSAAAF